MKTLPKPRYGPCMGHDDFTVMPFGLINGPAAFTDLMNRISDHILTSCGGVYKKDILKYSKDKDEHIVHLMTV